MILDWVGRPAHASELGRKQTEEVHSVSTADMRGPCPPVQTKEAGCRLKNGAPPVAGRARWLKPDNVVLASSILMRFTLLTDGTEVPCAGVSQIGP